MATKAHDTTKYISAQWDSYYSSAVPSGIVGDPDHQKNGGYHISIQDNKSSNYSVTRVDDKSPPGAWPRDLAAAIDMSMNPADMALCSSRLWDVWNDKTDPRRQYLNGFNGWFNDGEAAKRYDFVTQKISETTPDHKWHVHIEIRRRWVTSMFAAMAILSILRGETKQQYIYGLAQNGRIDDMYTKQHPGPDRPVDQMAMYAQAQMLFLAPHAATHKEHPLVADGKFGPNTAWWNSVLNTGGYGDVIDGQGFAKLNQLVTDKMLTDRLSVITIPDHVDLVIPASTIAVPATTVRVQVDAK